MNDRDTERISGLLNDAGFLRAHDPSEARVLLLNTCSIREKAEVKVYSELGRLRKLKEKSPTMVIGVGGCVAQQEGEKLLERVPDLDFVFGPQAIHVLPELIENGMKGQRGCAVFSTEDREVRFRDYRMRARHLPCNSRIKAFVTIMEGCDNLCSYCVVPRTRGREISRPPEDILREIGGLVENGVKEVTLLGQNVNSYGKKEGWMTFSDLLALIDALPGLMRLRFTTSHPKDLSEDLAASFTRLKTLCPHIHLPLQSGSTRILTGMNRGYTREEYMEKIRVLRTHCPEMSITTDIIVGFPGEEEGDFEETMEMMDAARFDGHFSFRFSPRPGTPAASMEECIPMDAASRRLQRLQEFQRAVCLEKNSAFIGKTVHVLTDGRSRKDDLLTGRTPCNRVVNFPGNPDMMGQEVEVTIDGVSVNSLNGRPGGVRRRTPETAQTKEEHE